MKWSFYFASPALGHFRADRRLRISRGLGQGEQDAQATTSREAGSGLGIRKISHQVLSGSLCLGVP